MSRRDDDFIDIDETFHNNVNVNTELNGKRNEITAVIHGQAEKLSLRTASSWELMKTVVRFTEHAESVGLVFPGLPRLYVLLFTRWCCSEPTRKNVRDAAPSLTGDRYHPQGLLCHANCGYKYLRTGSRGYQCYCRFSRRFQYGSPRANFCFCS